jgi:hypothetical protein
MSELENFPISQESALKKVIDANKNKINWSSDFPAQLKKNAKKTTIYQLMLESKLELKRYVRQFVLFLLFVLIFNHFSLAS